MIEHYDNDQMIGIPKYPSIQLRLVDTSLRFAFLSPFMKSQFVTKLFQLYKKLSVKDKVSPCKR